MHRLRTFPCFHSTLRLSLLALLALSLAACGVDAGSAPTLTPDPGLPATAAALFPTTAPTHAPTPTPLAESDAAESIARLLRQMQNAVLARDEVAYLALVDLDADETFRQEHTRWVEDWATAGGGLLRFELVLRNLTLNADSTQATADLNMAWSHLGSVQVSRGADFPVRFTRGDDGRWRYAGEHWAAELETEHFIVKAQPGLEPRLDALAAYLPEVYSRVTQSLNHAPQDRLVIKLYDTPWALIATTRLSLKQESSGWQEPGEALKMVAAAADESTIAHEFAHAVLFDLAGGTRGAYPWWAAEGAAETAASRFWTQSDRKQRIAAVQERRRTDGLVGWEYLSIFEETPESLWRYAYLQGYAFMAYLTDQYGDQARTGWVKALADASLEDATRGIFEVSFQDLNNSFLAWLDAQ